MCLSCLSFKASNTQAVGAGSRHIYQNTKICLNILF